MQASKMADRYPILDALNELGDVEVNHILITKNDFDIVLCAGEMKKVLRDGEKAHVNGNLSFVFRRGAKVCQYS